MERLRKKMHEVINEFGIDSWETLEISQLLDNLVVDEMKRINRGSINGKKEIAITHFKIET